MNLPSYKFSWSQSYHGNDNTYFPKSINDRLARIEELLTECQLVYSDLDQARDIISAIKNKE